MLRRITISIPDEDLRRARAWSKRRGTTLNELARCFLRLYADPAARRGRTLPELYRLATDAAGRGEGRLPRRRGSK